MIDHHYLNYLSLAHQKRSSSSPPPLIHEIAHPIPSMHSSPVVLAILYLEYGNVSHSTLDPDGERDVWFPW